MQPIHGSPRQANSTGIGQSRQIFERLRPRRPMLSSRESAELGPEACNSGAAFSMVLQARAQNAPRSPSPAHGDRSPPGCCIAPTRSAHISTLPARRSRRGSCGNSTSRPTRTKCSRAFSATIRSPTATPSSSKYVKRPIPGAWRAPRCPPCSSITQARSPSGYGIAGRPGQGARFRRSLSSGLAALRRYRSPGRARRSAGTCFNPDSRRFQTPGGGPDTDWKTHGSIATTAC